MKWIEIITLRSLVKANRKLVNELLCQVCQQKEDAQEISIKVYHEHMVETDLSIQIHWTTEALPVRTSNLGQRLLFSLKGLGLISYSIWVEASFTES